MGTELTALAAAAAMATRIIEPKNLSRMIVSFCLMRVIATEPPLKRPRNLGVVFCCGLGPHPSATARRTCSRRERPRHHADCSLSTDRRHEILSSHSLIPPMEAYR